jgi:hypothetical protein
VTRITDVAAERVLVVTLSSPARFAVEGGDVLPEPCENPDGARPRSNSQYGSGDVSRTRA